MKQPKKLTRMQKEAVSAAYLDAAEWALIEETEFYLKIINKSTHQRKIVDKFKRSK